MTHPETPWILPFDSSLASAPTEGLALVGGKGMNLAKMASAGLPVPGGCLITTCAYRDFVAANGLELRILAALTGLPQNGVPDPAALEAASAAIREMFAGASVPETLAALIGERYWAMGHPAVAVRSSATAEDLPEMSFAGQQDTYLNVVGEEALLRAVVDCWASLWTARAIGYRARNGIDPRGTALAVVVQSMVESEVSGVLFTANPLNGLRAQTVIDATYGLGEALVSGRVEPDHYEVDMRAETILNRTLGAKELSIHGLRGNGTMEKRQPRKDQQALSDAQILELARLGRRVEALYGAPQDIEWAWASGQFFVLQSRPVTSLFPTPTSMPPEPLRVMFSFAAVQGMLDPMTPYGREAIKIVFAMGSALFGYQYTADTQTVVHEAGERLWMNITTPLCNTVGRKIIPAAMNLVEPSARQALLEVLEDPRLAPERKGIRPRAMLRILGFALPLAWNILLNIASPHKRRARVVNEGEQILAGLRNQCAALPEDPYARLDQAADLLPNLVKSSLPRTFLHFVSIVGTGMAMLNLLRELASDLPEEIVGKNSGGWPEIVLDLTRGLPNNPTTEMDLDLGHMAQAIRSDDELRQEFQAYSPQELSERFSSGAISPVGWEMIAPFLEEFGARGLAEIDLGRARWREDPLHIFELLSSYLQIEDSSQMPDAVFNRGARTAFASEQRLVEALRKTKHGWRKARLAHFAAIRARALLGARESPKFFAVRMLDIVRQELLRIGEQLAQRGVLERKDDLFFLRTAEMKELAAARGIAAGENPTWRGLIAQRRAAYEREFLRRQIPRLLLSDGRAYYEGMRSNGAGGLAGSPVSPGSVEGRVRVVLDPRRANLQPGEIMVCPGTDPSWTPLFLTAGGLVMEVGGMMTHGAVVAREYGIPAVVGVDQATQRLKTGQRIRLDGSTGLIEIIEADNETRS